MFASCFLSKSFNFFSTIIWVTVPHAPHPLLSNPYPVPCNTRHFRHSDTRCRMWCDSWIFFSFRILPPCSFKGWRRYSPVFLFFQAHKVSYFYRYFGGICHRLRSPGITSIPGFSCFMDMLWPLFKRCCDVNVLLSFLMSPEISFRTFSYFPAWTVLPGCDSTCYGSFFLFISYRRYSHALFLQFLLLVVLPDFKGDVLCSWAQRDCFFFSVPPPPLCV